MIFYKEYTDVDELNFEVATNPQWLHEVKGYDNLNILVEWKGLSTTAFKHYENY